MAELGLKKKEIEAIEFAFPAASSENTKRNNKK